MTRKMTRTTVAFVIAALLVPGLASAKTCKNGVIIGDAMKATSVAITSKSAAKSAAYQNWIGNCMNRYGNPWCDAQNAAYPKYNFNRVPNGFGGYNWTATLHATPCRN
ncbi:hypothetical protein [Antarctobacter jejuensis]|uniref:hypothetical protein n=1 Tax=Antarctobacter jejuensis TaxID=1439938 RepID=UPI003FD5FE33